MIVKFLYILKYKRNLLITSFNLLLYYSTLLLLRHPTLPHWSVRLVSPRQQSQLSSSRPLWLRGLPWEHRRLDLSGRVSRFPACTPWEAWTCQARQPHRCGEHDLWSVQWTVSSTDPLSGTHELYFRSICQYLLWMLGSSIERWIGQSWGS